MGKLDEAESNLKKAIATRNGAGAQYAFDAAVSRENLAQVYEARRDLQKAKETRLSAGKLSMARANYSVRSCLLYWLRVMLKPSNSVQNNASIKRSCQTAASARWSWPTAPNLRSLIAVLCWLRFQSVYYCSAACQTQDWKMRHKRYCHAVAE